MKIIARFNRSKVIADRGHDLELMVRLRAPAQPDVAARPPIGIIAVIDVSGSMEGPKIDAVRHALRTLVDHLLPGDHAALVTFDTDVKRLCPLVEVTEHQKVLLKTQIGGLHAGSSTNLSGGLREGLAVAREALPTGLRTRVVLLTDGHANHGAATTHDELIAFLGEHGKGVAVSVFGLGDDCDQALLAAMADVGGGSYAYLANEDIVLTAYARELGGLVATYATGVELTVTPAAGAPVVHKLGDLLYQGAHVVSVPVAIATHVRAAGVEVCRIDATWKDLGDRVHKAHTVARIDYVAAGQEDTTDDAEVARLRDERLLALAVDEAEKHARQGDYADAAKAIGAVIAKLGDPALVAFARDALLPKFENVEAYGRSSGYRASSLAALKKKRRVSSDEDVDALFGDVATSAEAAMVESFKGKGGKKK